MPIQTNLFLRANLPSALTWQQGDSNWSLLLANDQYLNTQVENAAAAASAAQQSAATANNALANKVDKVSGKGLSTNDYTASDKTKLDGLPSSEALTQSFSNKVDKVPGKGLSSTDYTQAEKDKLAALVKTANSQDTTAGRLLQVGDFGLGVPVNLVTPNLNTISAPGFYYCNSPTNAPAAANGYLVVESASNNYVKQTFTAVDSDSMWFRRIFNGTALPWVPLKTSKNAISATVGTVGPINRIFLDAPGITDGELNTNYSYAGALEIREVNQVAQTKEGSPLYAPGISMHYGGYAINKLWMNTSAQLYWGGGRVITTLDNPALVERGANANGTYLKYDNGEMVCYSTKIVNGAVAPGAGVTLNTTSPPATFVGTPTIMGRANYFSAVGGGGDNLYTLMVQASVVGLYAYNQGKLPSNEHFSFTIGTVTAQSRQESIIWMGRWKA